MDVTGGDGGESGIEAVAFVNKDDSVVVVYYDHNQDGNGDRDHNHDGNDDHDDDHGDDGVGGKRGSTSEQRKENRLFWCSFANGNVYHIHSISSKIITS